MADKSMADKSAVGALLDRSLDKVDDKEQQGDVDMLADTKEDCDDAMKVDNEAVASENPQD